MSDGTRQRRGLKAGCFVLEGLNSWATVYYFYYFYFFMQQVHGFGNRANLVLAAINGGIYAVVAWQAGKFAQRFGYFTALKAGFAIMMAALGVGLCLTSVSGHILVMAATVVGMCFTWPTLEALVSEGESPAGLQHMVGIYNVVWAGTAAAANFTGGAMLQSLGWKSLFYVPMAIQAGQLALTLWLEARSKPLPRREAQPASSPPHPDPASSEALNRVSHTKSLSFLRMAWLANPFAYIAINTLIAVVPGVARRLELSTMLAGFCCSAWCFARVGAFVVLWWWAGWHYRFRWMLAAFLALVWSFHSILIAKSLASLVLAQIVFGVAAGLIYYSSLFYSMGCSDAKGEHGGIHEAVIGLGNCAGPMVGAASLYLLPQHADSGTDAVCLLLLAGLGGLVLIWRRGKTGAA